MTQPLSIELTPHQARIVRARAEKEGVSPELWLKRNSARFLRRLLEDKTDDGLDPREAAELLGVSRFTVLRYIEAGKLPNTVRLSQRKFRIDPDDVAKLKADGMPGAASRR